VTRLHCPFYGPADFPLSPSVDGVTARLSWRLTALRKSGQPRGRPINSFRRNALNSGSSGSAPSRSAKLATRSRKGWTLTKPSSTPAVCAGRLECCHSEALATPRARGIERGIADGGDQMIFIHRQRPEAALEQMSGLPSPCIEVSSEETAPPRQRQAGGVGRRKDETDAIGHEAIGRNRNAELSTRLSRALGHPEMAVAAEGC